MIYDAHVMLDGYWRQVKKIETGCPENWVADGSSSHLTRTVLFQMDVGMAVSRFHVEYFWGWQNVLYLFFGHVHGYATKFDFKKRPNLWFPGSQILIKQDRPMYFLMNIPILEKPGLGHQ